jgi:hypothetical protein
MAREAEENKPRLQNMDEYSNKISKLITGKGWKFFKEESAKEKLISLAYEDSAFSRLH